MSEIKQVSFQRHRAKAHTYDSFGRSLVEQILDRASQDGRRPESGKVNMAGTFSIDIGDILDDIGDVLSGCVTICVGIGGVEVCMEVCIGK